MLRCFVAATESGSIDAAVILMPPDAPFLAFRRDADMTSLLACHTLITFILMRCAAAMMLLRHIAYAAALPMLLLPFSFSLRDFRLPRYAAAAAEAAVIYQHHVGYTRPYARLLMSYARAARTCLAHDAADRATPATRASLLATRVDAL